MMIQGPHALTEKDQIFMHIEHGGTSAVTRGFVMTWDATDNSAVAGILANTWGLRVVLAAATLGLPTVAGAQTAMASLPATAANTRGSTFLIQCGGYAELQADTLAATNALAAGGNLGGFETSSDTAGTICGPTTPVAVDAYGNLGTSLKVLAANNTATNHPVVIRLT